LVVSASFFRVSLPLSGAINKPMQIPVAIPATSARVVFIFSCFIKELKESWSFWRNNVPNTKIQLQSSLSVTQFTSAGYMSGNYSTERTRLPRNKFHCTRNPFSLIKPAHPFLIVLLYSIFFFVSFIDCFSNKMVIRRLYTPDRDNFFSAFNITV